MELLLKEFNTLAAAPGGVARLREIILQLAVRGKLVPQDATDEPASVLLEKIVKEKGRLVKEGKIKKEKPLPPITEKEKTFELPEGWEWVRFGGACISRDAERIPVSKDIREDRRGQYDYYGASGVIDSIDDYLFDEKLLLIGEDGANLINRSTPIAFIAEGKFWVNNHAHVLDAVHKEMLDYFAVYINSIDLRPYVTGTAQPKMNQAKMNSIATPLPPLAEQHRIVERVNALMALCDQLEAQQAEAEKLHTATRTAALAALSDAEDEEAFHSAWQRVLEQYDSLLTTPEDVDALRQTILQLAVRGKLVPQDATDEPASVLQEQIAKEKARLVKEGKIKKDKPLPPIQDDEKPFALPEGWEWCRLGEVCELISGQHLTAEEQAPQGIGLPYLTGPADFGMKHPAASRWTNVRKAIAEYGAILITVKGAGVGKINILAMERVAIGRQLMSINVIGVGREFTYLLLKQSIEYFQNKSVGMTVPGLSRDDILEYAFPLPPLNEQRRIVAKVEQLLTLCDTLQANLAEARSTAERLAGAVAAGCC